MKYLNKLTKLPVEYYVVIFLFLVLIFMCIYGNSNGLPGFSNAKTLNMYAYENFQSSFSQPVHSAANVNGNEKPVLEETKGVLGVFEADGLKAAPIDAPPIFDPVSKLKGSPDCTGTGVANGYSNSMGALCFTDEVNGYFQSRGRSPLTPAE